MLGAVRRGPALAQALRACAPRSILSVRATAPLARWQRPSAPIAALQVRSFRLSATLRDAGSATAQELEQAPENEGPLTEFQQLADRGLVSPSLIFSITKKMNITTMTEVQRMTINETLKGVDV
jgi:ATP-dependent RNA helicase MSS116